MFPSSYTTQHQIWKSRYHYSRRVGINYIRAIKELGLPLVTKNDPEIINKTKSILWKITIYYVTFKIMPIRCYPQMQAFFQFPFSRSNNINFGTAKKSPGVKSGEYCVGSLVFGFLVVSLVRIELEMTRYHCYQFLNCQSVIETIFEGLLF